MGQDQASESQKRHISLTTDLADCPPQGVPCPPIVVHVLRPKEVENSRKDLPIVMLEQEIMEAINENPTVIICGETGCGKTTQVPQVTSLDAFCLTFLRNSVVTFTVVVFES